MEEKIEEIEELQDRIVETTALNESLKHEIETTKNDLESARAQVENDKVILITSQQELQQTKASLEEVNEL